MSNPKKNIKNIRIDYSKSSIDFNNIIDSPFELFKSWLDLALEIDPENANAFVLSTVSSKNNPSSRVVLLRGILEKSFVFYTNYSSAKAKDLDENNNVSLNFFWPYLEKQVRIKGVVSKLSDLESDTYFKSRPISSQLGAHSSKQSSSLPLNFSFDKIVNSLEEKYKNKDVGRPVFWGGYMIEISYFEFWQGRPSRLHDRLCYTLVDGVWTIERLSP